MATTMYAIRFANVGELLGKLNFPETFQPSFPFRILKIPGSTLTRTQWIRLTQDIEKSINYPVTNRNEIQDGQVLTDLIIADERFPNHEYDFNEHLLVIGNNSGLLTAKSFTNEQELARRTIPHDGDVFKQMPDYNLLFVDQSVLKFLNVSKRDRSEETFSTAPSQKKIHGEELPDDVQKALSEVELTPDVRMAALRLQELQVEKVNQIHVEHEMETEKLMDKLREKENTISYLESECENQIAKEKTRNDEQLATMQASLQSAQEKIAECEKEKLPGEDNVRFNAPDPLLRNNELWDGVNAQILANKEKVERKIEQDQYWEQGSQGGNFDILDSNSGGASLQTALITGNLEDTPSNRLALAREVKSRVQVASSNKAKGSGWQKHYDQQWRDFKKQMKREINERGNEYNSSNSSEAQSNMEIDETLNTDANRIMTLTKLPNLQKLGVSVWDPERISALEHLGNLATSFQFKLKTLDEDQKKAVVTQSFPQTFDWMYSHIPTTATTATTMIKKICELLIGKDEMVADQLMQVKQRINEDPLAYHARLSKMCSFIGSGDGKNLMSYQIIRNKIETILSTEARMEFKRHLEKKDKDVSSIGTVLVELRQFLGPQSMMANQTPEKSYLQEEISTMNSGSKKKTYQRGRCYECNSTKHWKKDCPRLSKKKGQKGHFTSKEKKDKKSGRKTEERDNDN